jgi:hypothetical protein
LGQALSLATGADGKLAVGTRDEVCQYSASLARNGAPRRTAMHTAWPLHPKVICWLWGEPMARLFC